MLRDRAKGARFSGSRWGREPPPRARQRRKLVRWADQVMLGMHHVVFSDQRRQRYQYHRGVGSADQRNLTIEVIELDEAEYVAVRDLLKIVGGVHRSSFGRCRRRRVCFEDQRSMFIRV